MHLKMSGQPLFRLQCVITPDSKFQPIDLQRWQKYRYLCLQILILIQVLPKTWFIFFLLIYVITWVWYYTIRSSILCVLPFLYARLKNGTYYAVAMSLRPSVRPRFPDFSSTCFEISISNLAYTFSRCHDMSSLSCITIGSFWPSLQPKVGQTNFLQSWPHKSRQILQILYTGGLLYTSRHKFRFL